MTEKKYKIALGGAALLFLALYSVFPFMTGTLFNSPDETANWHFLKTFSLHGDFASFEPLNFWFDGAVHPRSISWNGSVLVPQGFVGLPLLYGWLARLFSLDVAKFATPLLAIAGIAAFYGFLKRIFGRMVAGVSFLLLLSFPIYWYYSSRYLYSAILFAAMLMIAAWASDGLLKDAKNRRLIVFSGAFVLGVMMRPAEVLWVAPLAALVAYIYRREISWSRIFYAAAIGAAVAIPFFQANIFLYGSPLRTGYLLSGPAAEGINWPAIFNLAPWQRIFLPFGFSAKTIIGNVFIFLIKYFWQYSLPAIGGFAIWFAGKKTKEERIYALIAIMAAVWLVLFYGSGKFSDNPSGGVTLGDSHLRYWLPIFILMMPFAAKFFSVVLARVKPLRSRVVVAAGLAVFFLAMSVNTTVYSYDDGLLAVAKNLKNNEAVKSRVLQLTANRDVIVTGRQDKVFFPERTVLYVDKLTPPLLMKIVNFSGRDFYYFAIGIKAEELNNFNLLLGVYGYKLERVEIFDKEVLYRFEKMHKNFAYYYLSFPTLER
ncbi:MAG: hypothetical protein WC693_06205 [Patescibacteria group bacterium]|jgi:hypothetical protein